MYSKIDDVETMINDKADEVIEKLFVFDCAHLLYHKYHKVYPNRCGSYPDIQKSSIKIIINTFTTL